MARTVNYLLYVTESTDNPKFCDLRNELCANENSNMTIIDAVLAGKAEQSAAVEAILYAASWAGAAAPYTQTISIEGLTSTQNGEIAVSMGATSTQRDIARRALLSVTGQGTGVLTISADGELPITDIPVTVIMIG